MGDEMESSSSPNVVANETSPSSELIREGSYVSKGQTLFSLINTQSLKVELNLPPTAGRHVKKGNPITLVSSTGDSVATTIDFIEPLYQAGQKFLTARVYKTSPLKLQLGQLVAARIKGIQIEGIWVPRMAVVKMGLDEVVFVKEKNGFVPRKVKTGITNESQINILAGLSSADEIASSAQYLIDSESFIKIDN